MIDRVPVLRVFVPGKAAPGGSKKAFQHAATGKVIVTDDAKGNKEWRQRVALFASQQFGRAPLAGPLEVWATFVVARPRGHYRVGKFAHAVRDGAPAHPTTKPDATKLFRAAEDALTGVVWLDDSQIVDQHVKKVYGDRPGLELAVYEVES